MGKLIQTISRDFRANNDTAVASYGLKLALGLPEVEPLKNITPSAPEGQTLIEMFTKAIATAKNGGTVAVARKNELRQQVLDLLDAWTTYALNALPANPLLWMEAGFKLTKEASAPAQPLPAPTKFYTTEGSSKGSVRVYQNAQAGTKTYVNEYARVPAAGKEPAWEYFLCTKSDCEISDLDSKAEYLFRGAAWNGTTRPVFSPAESRVVQ